jgi:hypothetical protein
MKASQKLADVKITWNDEKINCSVNNLEVENLYIKKTKLNCLKNFIPKLSAENISKCENDILHANESKVSRTVRHGRVHIRRSVG